MENKFFHPIDFVLLPILFIIATFNLNTTWQYLSIISLAYCNLLLIAKPIRHRILFIFILYMLPVLLAIFLSSYIFANSAPSSKLGIASLLTTRYFTLAIISFAFAMHTQSTQVFNYLIQRKVLPVKIGYATFAAFNSFSFLTEEFRRIQIAYKMRYGKNYLSPLIFFALMTTAARYAHNLSISMYCRGINSYKTFVDTAPKLKVLDYILYLTNFIIMALVILI